MFHYVRVAKTDPFPSDPPCITQNAVGVFYLKPQCLHLIGSEKYKSYFFKLKLVILYEFIIGIWDMRIYLFMVDV